MLPRSYGWIALALLLALLLSCYCGAGRTEAGTTFPGSASSDPGSARTASVARIADLVRPYDPASAEELLDGHARLVGAPNARDAEIRATILLERIDRLMCAVDDLGVCAAVRRERIRICESLRRGKEELEDA
jgi:hypothetical protein